MNDKNTLKMLWHTVRQALSLLLISVFLIACSQGSNPQNGSISGDKLSAPLPKALTVDSLADATLVVDVIIDGDNDNPMRVENLVVDTTNGTYTGTISGFPTGTFTIILVYSINDPLQGIVEVIRTSSITVDIVANEETPADFSSATAIYTDTDGDTISNLDELEAGTDISIMHYRITGQIIGLTGSGLVLQNILQETSHEQGTDNLSVDSSDTDAGTDADTTGSFTFSKALTSGSSYDVTIQTPPSEPNQTCTVFNGNGTIDNASVSNITITCTTQTYNIGGIITGLTSSGLVLKNNNESLNITGVGDYTFNTPVADGGGYNVTVATQPTNPSQFCSVSYGNETADNVVNGVNVTDVNVTCASDAYSVSGSVSGYDGNGLTLQNNSDVLIITQNGNFTFNNLVANGASFNITAESQSQNCNVSNDSGTIDNAPTTSVVVSCISAPVVSNVSILGAIGGSVFVGYQLTGTYTLTDADNNAKDNSLYRWYRDNIAIVGATAITYTLTANDSAKSIAFEVTPVATAGSLTGNAVRSNPPLFVKNSAPVATRLSITDDNGGSIVVGVTLTGIYDYFDADEDEQGTSTFRWLRAGVAIAGETLRNYTVVAADINQSITFEVTPVASRGLAQGAAVTSSVITIENSAPVFTSGNTVNVVENTVITGYIATATDAEADTVTFSVSGGADGALFVIDGTSGSLSFNTAPDFENPKDTTPDNRYVIEISATDGTGIVLQTVTIIVDDVLEILEIAASSAGIKTIRFDWTNYAGATTYKLLVNADGNSGFSVLQDNLTGTSTTIELPVHMTDWVNASYLLEAHNATGKLVTSTAIDITSLMIASIGYVKSSNSDVSDQFGSEVSLSADGQTLAVSALGEGSNVTGVNEVGQGVNTALRAGAVYVFARIDGVWVQQAYVKASNTEGNDGFGISVSLSADGNTLAVGAYGEDSSATGVATDNASQLDNTSVNSGAVYVFTRDMSKSWGQTAYIKASNTGNGDQFGTTVSISADGRTLAVGALTERSSALDIDGDQSNNSSSNAGAVYVFVQNGSGTWGQQAYVKASNTAGGANFGFNVSLSADGNTLAVGARNESGFAKGISNDGSGEAIPSYASNSGAVYVYTRSGSVWSQQAYVKSSNSDAFDNFGTAVSLSVDGNTMAVGATGEDGGSTGLNGDLNDNSRTGSGAVYLFARNGAGIWAEQAYVKPSNTGVKFFGGEICLSSNGYYLVVGAIDSITAIGVGGDQLDSTATNSGSAYLMRRSMTGDWENTQVYIKASNTEKDDRFGFSVSLSSDGRALAVGAGFEGSGSVGIGGIQSDNSALKSGAVYLY